MSSATTMGGSTTAPCARPSSNAGTGRPPRKSIQTDVSTTRPLTRFVQVDLELDLPAQCHRLAVGTCAAYEMEPGHESVSDALARYLHRIFEQVAWDVGGHSARLGHTMILMFVLTAVNTLCGGFGLGSTAGHPGSASERRRRER